jgi:vacuolar-type H+-ATPase subunit I/STV1
MGKVVARSRKAYQLFTGKRITPKQKAARRRNIAIARKFRKRASNKKANLAFKETYKKNMARKYMTKDIARIRATNAAIRADKVRGLKMATTFAKGKSKKLYSSGYERKRYIREMVKYVTTYHLDK